MKHAPPAAAAVLLAALLAACASSAGSRVSSKVSSRAPAQPATTSPTSAAPAATAPLSTIPGQLPTVFDCGGGAYEPATLLVVCGVSSTTVTGTTWSSWTATGASGRGDLHIGPSGGPARLELSEVVGTPNGPQFSRLDATWIGPSPDGRRTEVFRLQVAT